MTLVWILDLFIIVSHLVQWNVFKAKGVYLIHFNFNSLLPKIDEIQYIAARTNSGVTAISESMLDETILQSEIQMSNHEFLRRDKTTNGGVVACYIGDIVCLKKPFFPRKVENIFVEILLPKTKLLITGII